MKILITGGMGFQGSHLAEKLCGLGHEVVLLNTLTPQALLNQKYLKGKAEIIWGSVTDAEVTEKAMRGKDIVFHLGAKVNVSESILHPWEVLDANLRGTFNVLEASRRTGSRIIYASSSEVYGRPLTKAPLDETAELRPMSPYAASKAAADRLGFAYFQTYKTPVTILRFFNIFGERQREGNFGAVIPIFTGRAIRGEALEVFGDGEQSRDYLHISDVLGAYCSVLDHPELSGEVINFGTGSGTRIKDIAEYIAKKFNGKVRYTAARPGEATGMIADFSKAKRLLGWEPKVGIYEGLDRYIAWRRAEDHNS
ncbi:MAG: GDP-mannose 4,6-dehydratase [bacterium]|nr:GDP-mannose 4,6-dehydratase [bacterium]